MEEAKIDHAAMGRLFKALVFICGPDHPTTVALKTAAESGSDRDIKSARTLFLKLEPGVGAIAGAEDTRVERSALHQSA